MNGYRHGTYLACVLECFPQTNTRSGKGDFIMFEIVNNRQIIFGENKIQEIGGILKWYNKKKVFFATF